MICPLGKSLLRTCMWWEWGKRQWRSPGEELRTAGRAISSAGGRGRLLTGPTCPLGRVATTSWQQIGYTWSWNAYLQLKCLRQNGMRDSVSNVRGRTTDTRLEGKRGNGMPLVIWPFLHWGFFLQLRKGSCLNTWVLIEQGPQGPSEVLHYLLWIILEEQSLFDGKTRNSYKSKFSFKKKSCVLYPRRLKANIFKANIGTSPSNGTKAFLVLQPSLVGLISKIIFQNSPTPPKKQSYLAICFKTKNIE